MTRPASRARMEEGDPLTLFEIPQCHGKGRRLIHDSGNIKATGHCPQRDGQISISLECVQLTARGESE